MDMFIYYFLLVSQLILKCTSKFETGLKESLPEDGHCDANGEGNGCTTNDKHSVFEKDSRLLEDFKLVRLDDIGVGNSRIVHLPDGVDREVKEVNSKPLVFEIEKFLTDEECAYFIDVAKNKGLRSSNTAAQGIASNRFVLMDINRDGSLNVDELRLTIENSLDVYLDNNDVETLIEEKGLDPNKDGLISKEELASGLTPNQLKIYTDLLLEHHPEKHSRFSKQVWLFADTSKDEQFKKLQQKVSAVTQLPMNLIRMADFQVVNYGMNGHYNAHWDSTQVDNTIPCCTRTRSYSCRMCRYMTILFYLNDVEEGGGTAFPIANNETMDYQYIRQQQLVNLYRNCNEAKFVVNPRKGKVIMWYNHFIDEKDGWIGRMDNFTLHGGCAVNKGEKWIANFWIKVTDDRESDIQKIKSFP